MEIAPVEAFRMHGWRLVNVEATPSSNFRSEFLVFWQDKTGAVTAARHRKDPHSIVLTFRGVASAVVSKDNKTASIFPLVSGLSRESLDHIAMDGLLPRLIDGSGRLVLHAATVANGAKALCFLGASGLGKSTLSAGLESAGSTLLGDDAVEVWPEDSNIFARATYRSLRLFPDSVDRLFSGAPTSVSPVADYLHKWRVNRGGPAQSEDQIQLTAVFVLGPDDGSDEIRVRRVSQTELCMGLITHSFALDPVEPAGVHRRMKSASIVASKVAGFEICYPRKYDRLCEVIAQINAVFADEQLCRQNTRDKMMSESKHK